MEEVTRAVLSSRQCRREIVRLASTSGLASVAELSRRFAVTASTIRRDLARLTEEGLITRTHGGVAPPTARPEEPLLLDVGTTVGALAHELRATSPLTVVTTGLTTVRALAEAGAVQVVCLGGRLRHVSRGFAGPLTETALERVTGDAVFRGADGVDVGDRRGRRRGSAGRLPQHGSSRRGRAGRRLRGHRPAVSRP
ncbi:DeoR family transcriptional regulator [Kineococcus sp. SYSU DK003]|uniref:DeoR family transcriptional regulator n=1 Tax=Kineococcus sp. SYSU DK003 TaxID=3383124 RepID=UPI003D7EAD7C